MTVTGSFAASNALASLRKHFPDTLFAHAASAKIVPKAYTTDRQLRCDLTEDNNLR